MNAPDSMLAAKVVTVGIVIQKAMHDMDIDIAELLMFERLWKSADGYDDFENGPDCFKVGG